MECIYVLIFLSLSVFRGEKREFRVAHMMLWLLHLGTFLGRSAAESEEDCEACYPGSYCPSWAQTSVDLICPNGWFCPMGSVSGHQPGIVHIYRGQLALTHSNLCTSCLIFFSFLNTASAHSLVSSVSSLCFQKIIYGVSSENQA